MRVGSRARADVRLLQQGFERTRKLVNLRAGSNTLELRLPASLGPGTYRLVIVIRSGGQQKTVGAAVLVAAKPSIRRSP